MFAVLGLGMRIWSGSDVLDPNQFPPTLQDLLLGEPFELHTQYC